MANSDVDGGAAPDIPTGGRRVAERTCGMQIARDWSQSFRQRRPAEGPQDRYAGGDECHSLFANYRLPLALFAARQLSATLDGL
jgi:hypothetical protein